MGLVLLVVCIGSTAGIYAKYIQSETTPVGSITSKSFYFTSNYLSEENPVYNLNSDATSVTILLQNYDGLRVSNVDVTYYVDVTKKKDGEPDVIDPTTIINATPNTKNTEGHTVNFEPGYTYEVSVTAKGGKKNVQTDRVEYGYAKTLTATFIVAPASNNIYKNVDRTPSLSYVVLTVWTENVTGTVSITYPAGLIPDTTNPIMKTIVNGGDYTGGTFIDTANFTSKYSSYSYRFFKTAGYQESGEFSVTITDGTNPAKDAVTADIP